MFQNIIDWYNQDSKSKIKLIFVVLVTFFLIFLVVIIIIVNTSVNQNTNTNSSQSSVQSSSDNTKAIEESNKLLNESLTARKLEKKSENLLLNTRAILLKSGVDFYFNELGKVVYNNEVINSDFQVNASSVFQNKNYIFFNGKEKVGVFDTSSKKITGLSEQILSVYADQDDIYTIEKSGSISNQVKVFKYKSVDQIISKAGTEFASGEISSNNIDFRKVGNTFIILSWEGALKSGTVALNYIQSSKIVNVGNINSVFDYKLFNDGILINTLKSDNIKYYNFTKIVNKLDDIKSIIFESDEDVINKILSDNDLNPFVIASRCDFKSSQVLYCLTKKDKKTSVADIFAPDEIIEINLQTKKVTKSYSNLFLSAKFLYWDASSNTHYIAAQTDAKLYKIVNLK